jgi:transcriptional regulator with XRE-family HTH domain
MVQGNRMSAKEIRELLELRGWSQAELARQLGLHESSVSLWLTEGRTPRGPACILMRQWLIQARQDAQKQPA